MEYTGADVIALSAGTSQNQPTVAGGGDTTHFTPFGVLLGDYGSSSNNGDGNNGDGSGSSSNNDRLLQIILPSVLVPVAIIVVVLVIIGAIAAGLIIKWIQVRQRSKGSSMVNYENSTTQL